MQNKGLIRFLTYAFLLVCLFQLTFTFVTRNIEKHARADVAAYVKKDSTTKLVRELAGGDELKAQIVRDSLSTAREAYYLDSMAKEKVFLGFTYRQCQARELNLGLDLKGGMNVMMEVSTVDVVRSLSGNTQDSVFNQAINLALKRQKTTTNENFVDLFYAAIKEIKPD